MFSAGQSPLRRKLLRISSPEDLAHVLRSDYLLSLGIDGEPRFLNGKCVDIILPKQTTRHGVLVLGAYPTALFEQIDGHFVPADNIAEPFDPLTASGKELDRYYLDKLGLNREQCWITNLLKVFLFKPGHMGHALPSVADVARSRFEDLASSEANLEWLDAELRIASPRLVITLGREVAGIIRGVNNNAARNALLKGCIQEYPFRGQRYLWIHLPHPGIVMRKGSVKNKWPRRHAVFCARLRAPIKDLLTSRGAEFEGVVGSGMSDATGGSLPE
jgi:hypothetical protein